MVDCDTGKRRNDRVCDGGCVEGVWVADWEEKPGYARQGWDMRGSDGLDRDVGVGGRVPRRDDMRVGLRMEDRVCICWWFRVGGFNGGGRRGLGGD